MLEQVITRYIDNMIELKVKEKLDYILKQEGVSRIKNKKYAKAKELAEMFGVSKTTVYEDIKQMEVDPVFSKYVLQSSKIKQVKVDGYEKFRIKLSNEYLR